MNRGRKRQLLKQIAITNAKGQSKTARGATLTSRNKLLMQLSITDEESENISPKESTQDLCVAIQSPETEEVDRSDSVPPLVGESNIEVCAENVSEISKTREYLETETSLIAISCSKTEGERNYSVPAIVSTKACVENHLDENESEIRKPQETAETQCSVTVFRHPETQEDDRSDSVSAAQYNQGESDGDFSSGSGELYEPSDIEAIEVEDIAAEVEIATEARGDGQTETLKRKRKSEVDCKEWKRHKNAQLRLQGKAYLGFKKDVQGKYQQTEIKQEKHLGPRCNGHQTQRTSKGGPKQNFLCDTISEEDRQSIFSAFWKLSTWESKKVYVTGCVLQARPRHRRTDTDIQSSRKKVGFKFYLTVKEDDNDKVRKQVCKKLFLSTLCIGEKSFRSWVLDGGLSRAEQPEHDNAVVDTCSERSAIVKNVDEFLNSLPKLESHYCRASSNKLYLEPTWSSFREMHRFYVSKCQNENKKSASWKTFYNAVKKLNLDIYTPKKDQCNECTMHKNGNLDEQIFQKHVEKKNQARSEKENDKTISKNSPEIQTYTVDLQAVLLSPRLNAAANYYKTKLKVHNLTYYNLSSKDVVCYVWHEASGGLESDVFASLATNYLQKEIDTKKPDKLIIWSDGCGYQNRNVKMSNALLELSIKNTVVIEQKYLTVGHTQMEVDSIHAAIEKKLGKRKEVYVPADYLPIIHSSRQNPRPYQTVYCQYSDFFKFEPVYYKSIRPGNKVGDLCVNDVVAYQYTPEGIINFKIKFEDDWVSLPARPKRVDAPPLHGNLYSGPCPIEASKFGHLQELKTLIPQDYHAFYNSLTHN